MPYQQFDETRPYLVNNTFDHAASAGIPLALGWNTAGVSRLDAWAISSTDTIDHVIDVGVYTSGIIIQMATITIPAGAGQGTVPVVDVLAAIWGTALHYIMSAGNNDYAIQLDVVVSTGKLLEVTLMGGGF